MCGIAGFHGLKDPALLRAMTERLRHRGPDSDGYYEGEGVGLGMRRLAVIDPAGGKQPAYNETGDVVVVFNGEIYNFAELRRGLEKAGHRFASRADTEVIVHLYEERGEDLVRDLNGMFAFALWDRKRKRLLLARDHAGIKPLYYAVAGGRLAFASELKALLPFPGLSREISRAAMEAYLHWGSIPSPLSIFSQVNKLSPGHRLILDEYGMKTEAYWRWPSADPTVRVDEDEIAILFDQAVERQLVSDVPLGIFLSGGLDSGALAAATRRFTPGRLKTFTVGFAAPDDAYNELDNARLLAKSLDAEHHEFIVSPKIGDLLAPLARCFDEPFADSSAVPTYLISREARRHVTVALTGIGGDELFAGYPRHLGLMAASAAAMLPSPLKKTAARLGGLLPDRGGAVNWTGRAKRFLEGIGKSPAGQYDRWTSLTLAEYSAGKTNGLPDQSPDDIVRADAVRYMPDDLLCLADRTSMAHGLELRVPFLDLPLIEKLSRVPLKRKLAGFRLKSLLKNIAAPRLPSGYLRQPKKGFSIPLARWLREDLKEILNDALSPVRLKAHGLISPEAVARIKAEHEQGKRNHADALWALLMLELWHQELSSPQSSVQ